MKKILINVAQQEELCVALVDGQRLYNLNIGSPGHEQKKADIYKGKVTRVEPSLEAAFVDYGAKRHSFLPLREIAHEHFPTNCSVHGRPNIKDMLHEGQEAIAQIDKKECGNRGAALTTFISLAGSHLVLVPSNPRTGGISRRIKGSDRTESERALASLELPGGVGLIICTAGIGKSTGALQWDLSFRLKHWEATEKAAESRPTLLLIRQESNVIIRAFHGYLRQDIGEILIDSPKMLELARQHIAALGCLDFSSKVKLYTGEIPLLSHYQIESQIESTFQYEVRLPSDGSIVIDNAEALTAIDINSACAIRDGDTEEAAFNTNLEAADEIARQLRLRNLGGLIVTNFIDMMPVCHQRAVENRLHEAVCQNRARTQVSHISRSGLLEMSRQRLSPPLSGSSHHVCPRCSDTDIICDNESLSLSILRLIEGEALKENAQGVHTIIPVPTAPYLLNEKRSTTDATETHQDGVHCVVVPNDQMETPYYHALRVRKGEETLTLSCMLSKLYEEAMAPPSEEEFAEHKRSEQLVLATFAVPNVPPVPTSTGPTTPVVASAPKSAPATPAAPAQPGLLSRFSDVLRTLFSGGEETKPSEQPTPEAEAEPGRQQGRHKLRQNSRRDRSEHRDPRSERTEGSDNHRENRHNRRQAQQQAAETRGNCQQIKVTGRARTTDEQQTPRRERDRRRNDDKRQAQQEMEALNVEEQSVQETEQGERVRPVQSRRKQRQLSQKVCYEQNVAEEAVVAPMVEETIAAELIIQETSVPCAELVKIPLLVVVQATPEQPEENNVGNCDNGNMPCHSHRSPCHLYVSGQRHRCYRDERCPTQSPMPLVIVCASLELTSGKVWVRYLTVRSQGIQAEEQREQEEVRVQPIMTEVPVTAAVEPVVSTPVVEEVTKVIEAPAQVAGPQPGVAETTHPEVIAAAVTGQPQATTESNVAVAQEVAEHAEPVIGPQEETAGIEEVAKAVEVMIAEPEVVAQPAVSVVTEITAEVEMIAAVKPEVTVEHNRVTASMTRTPASEYVPGTPRHDDQQRPTFAFRGRGAASGHTAAHHASVALARPQPVE